MEKFVVRVLAAAAKNPDVQEFVGKQVDRLKENLLPDLLKAVVPLLPMFGEGLVKELIKHLPDINLPDGVNLVAGVAEQILDATPDTDVPILSDVVENLTGIDVSETIKDILRGFLR